jgi:hypothetical protein
MPAPPIKWREIRSNERDLLLDLNANESVDVDCTAGGTIVLTVAQREPVYLARLTGTPGAGFTVEFADGNKQVTIENASGQTATIETATGAASPPTVLDGDTAILQVRGTDISVATVVSLVDGSLLHGGQVDPTGNFDWLDLELKGAELLDTAYVMTSPSSSGNILNLDCELGNWFDVTLTENVDLLNILNPAIHFSGIRLEDGSGELILEDGSGKLLIEDNDAVANVFLITRQDGGGGHVLTFPAFFKWEQNTGDSPSPSTAANEVDIYWFFRLNSNSLNQLKLETGIDDHLGLEDGSGRLLLEDSGSTVWFSNQLGKNMG